MDAEVCPHVVYHCCAVNHYQELVRSQFCLLRQYGLTAALAEAGDYLRISHVGNDPQWILEEAARQDLPAKIVRQSENIHHFETFAMLEIERLAKVEKTERPILYFHTKGVTCPGDQCKENWRRVMEWHLIEHWRDRLQGLILNDACGFNFWFRGSNHFSGTFWIARAEWIRQLPDFVQFHHSQGLSRFSCELWIGSAPGIRALSLGCNDVVTWQRGFDWSWLMPPGRPRGDEITWISAATPEYADGLENLRRSAPRLGPGHHFHGTILQGGGPWRMTRKLLHLRETLPHIQSSHAAWIDSDCEFLTRLLVRDVAHAVKPLFAVRHFAYNRPGDHTPVHWHGAIVHNAPLYHQACLFGGQVVALRQLVDQALAHFGDDGGYDEHALNVEWDRLGPEVVHTLPCRYAYPITFDKMPQYQAEAQRRSEGAARIFHWNTEINR